MLEYANNASPAIIGRTKGRNKLIIIVETAISLARRHVAFTVAGTAISLGLAFVATRFLTVVNWDASGTLFYAPLTGPDSQGSLYVPPDLKTLVTLAKAPGNIETIRQEFKLKVPDSVLEKSFKVTIPTGTKTVDFEIRWGNGDEAARMVNRLMELFRVQVAEVRKAKINGYVEDFKEHVEGCRRRLQAANANLAEFNRKQHVGDVVADLGRLNSEIHDLDTELSRLQRERTNYETQLDALEKHVANLKDQDRVREQDAEAAEAAEETVADNRRRQDRLRELIAEERMKMEVNAKLEASRAEATRLAKLVERGHASREDLERVRASIGVLEAQIRVTDTIENWKTELERIDKVVVPKGKIKNQGSTAIEQIVFKKLELTLMMTAAARGIQEIKWEIGHREVEVQRLMGLQQEQRSLTKIVESCDAERLAASAELTALKKLQAIKTFEFAIITPASPGPFPASSNKKMLLIGISLLGISLTLGSLAIADFVLWPTVTQAQTVGNLGLPILAKVANRAGSSPWKELNTDEDPAIRLLALRIRQAVPEPGSVILLSSLNESAGSATLACSLARCFARRDERVLILDLAGDAHDQAMLTAFRAPWSPPADSSTEAAGLHAYLVFECDDPSDFVFPGAVNGVDCMPAGDLLYGVELLATHRMRELFLKLKSSYSLILAIGPRGDHQVDLELLAANSTAVVFHASDHEGFCQITPTEIRDLSVLGVPILGAVLAETVAPVVTKPARPRPPLGLTPVRALPALGKGRVDAGRAETRLAD